MEKYTIEGGIDFFAELYKSLDEKNTDEENVCLITNKPLVDKFVELNCGHKFNYLPLYNDIHNHKQKFNHMEGSNSLLKKNEIRCPYCRKKQTGVLPYYEELVSEKINGVNFYDSTYNEPITSFNAKYVYSIYFTGKCDFVTPLLDNSFKTCNTTYVTDLNNKTYCCIHKCEVIKQQKKEKLIKEKEEKKKAKDELKQQSKEAKEAKKILKITQNQLKKNKEIKQIKEINNEENIVISSSLKEGCSQLLKFGINKGTLCGLNVLSDCLCKRHYNLKNK